MRERIKRVLVALVALALVLTSFPQFSGVSKASASSLKKVASASDTTVKFYERSYFNWLRNTGNTEFASKMMDSKEASKFTKISTSRITSSYTFYTLDGDWCLSAETSANSVKLKSLSYQGKKLDVTLDIPDFIDFNYISSVESIEKGKDDDDSNSNRNMKQVTTSHSLCTVTEIGQAFSMSNDDSTCTTMHLFVPKRVTTVDDRAFYENTRLVSVIFEGDIQAIGKSAFEGCTRLTNLDLAGVFETVANNTIPNRCFYKCSSLENVVIPSTILNIGEEAFYQCDKIDYIILRDSIKTVGDNAFAMCSNLRYLYIESNYSDWKNVVNTTELNKLITDPVTDAPLISKLGDSAAIGSNIYQATDISIASKVDIDMSSVSVQKNGVSIKPIPYTCKIFGHDTNAVHFKVNTTDKGVYTISAKDILGNTINKTISYASDVNDITPPVVNIVGEGADDWYQSATIEVSDADTYISSIMLDGKAIDLAGGNSFKCDEVGEHVLEVKDAFGNTTTKSFGIDKETPEVKGVEEGGLYSREIDVKAEDDISGIKDFILDGQSMGAKSPLSIYKSGVHTLDVVDKALNKVTYHFTIDTEGPSLDKVMTNKYYNKAVKCKIVSICGYREATVIYTAPDGSRNKYSLNDGQTLKKNGEYTIYIKDALGESINYNFVIDTIAPKITGVSNGRAYSSKEVEYNVTDTNLSKVYRNGKLSSSNSYVRNDGTYTIKAIDKAGNVTVVKFYKGKKVGSKITGITNKAKYKAGFKLKLVGTKGIKKITVNNKKVKNGYKFTKSGKYTVVVIDKANKKFKYTIYVDVKAPTSNIVQGKTYSNSVKVVVKDDYSGVKSIKLNGSSIKSGAVIKVKGAYTLTVTDKFGNSKSVNFFVG